MRITAEISMYPLQEVFVPKIQEFIVELRKQDGLEVVTNQMSTQLRGDFDRVTDAINYCMRVSMEQDGIAMFVIKYLNADLPITTTPRVEFSG